MTASRTESKKSKPLTQQEMKRQTIANRIADKMVCSTKARPAFIAIVEKELSKFILFHNSRRAAR